jgi:hypothetical protein
LFFVVVVVVVDDVVFCCRFCCCCFIFVSITVVLEYVLTANLEYGKQDQQGKAAFNERYPHTTKQQGPAARNPGGNCCTDEPRNVTQKSVKIYLRLATVNNITYTCTVSY